MVGQSDGRTVGRIIVLAAFLSVGPTVRPSDAQDTTAGKIVYVKWCAGCHGDTGAGDGPAAHYMLPRPRDFTGAVYQIRSTASGELPTDADVLRAVDRGLPGSAMPGWKTRLSDRERRNVVAYLKTFSTFFGDTTIRPQPLQFGKAPGGGGGGGPRRCVWGVSSTTRSVAANATGTGVAGMVPPRRP